jgi:hypothetical protein
LTSFHRRKVTQLRYCSFTITVEVLMKVVLEPAGMVAVVNKEAAPGQTRVTSTTPVTAFTRCGREAVLVRQQLAGQVNEGLGVDLVDADGVTVTQVFWRLPTDTTVITHAGLNRQPAEPAGVGRQVDDDHSRPDGRLDALGRTGSRRDFASHLLISTVIMSTVVV